MVVVFIVKKIKFVVIINLLSFILYIGTYVPVETQSDRICNGIFHRQLMIIRQYNCIYMDILI